MTRLAPLVALLLLGGCSKSQEDLKELLNGDCAGSPSVKCMAAKSDLTVLELQDALEKAQDEELRDRFIAENGKQAYRNQVVKLHEQLLAAEMLTISGSTAFFAGDKPFSPKYLKYSDQKLAVEKSKDIIRQRLDFTRKLDEELSSVPTSTRAQSLLKMDAADVGQSVDQRENASSGPTATTEDNNAELPSSTSAQALAPSFDCAKASTDIEGMICSDQNLSALDSRLAEIYGAIRSDPESGENFKADQRAWIKEKRSACKDTECLRSAYTERVDELETVYRYLSKPADFR